VIQNAGVAGSIASPYLSMWDGSRFEPLPALGFGPQALGIWNAHLVVACGSSSFSINPILMLDGSAWDTLGVANSSVSAFCEYQGFLAAGGAFSSVNGVPASSVAVFDGVTWSAPGTGLSGNVTSLTTHAGGLVAAVLKCVALDALGGAWHTVGAGFTGSAYSVLSDGTYLYACGQLIASGAVPMGCLARWDGSSWASLTTVHVGFSEQRMTRWNGRIVVTGRAGTVGLLGQWDGASYGPVPGDSLGFGDGNNAFNLSTWGTKLIVTGNFVTNGSVPVPRLATYDGGPGARSRNRGARECRGRWVLRGSCAHGRESSSSPARSASSQTRTTGRTPS
jgi:hypothetical protein